VLVWFGRDPWEGAGTRSIEDENKLAHALSPADGAKRTLNPERCTLAPKEKRRNVKSACVFCHIACCNNFVMSRGVATVVRPYR